MVEKGHRNGGPDTHREDSTMTIRKTAGTLTHGAISTAVSVLRHPVGSAAMAAGLVKGAAEAGVDLVRRGGRTAPDRAAGETPQTGETAETAVGAPEHAVPVADVPTAEELPEPVVIEAEPAPDETAEPFHTEPKAASRASAHGGPAGDREEVEGYVEEIPEADQDEEQPVYVSQSEPGEPVLDSAAAKSVRAEAEVLQRAADPHKE